MPLADPSAHFGSATEANEDVKPTAQLHFTCAGQIPDHKEGEAGKLRHLDSTGQDGHNEEQGKLMHEDYTTLKQEQLEDNLDLEVGEGEADLLSLLNMKLGSLASNAEARLTSREADVTLDLLRRGQAHFRDVRDASQEALVLSALVKVYLCQDALDQAQHAAEEALALRRELGDKRDIADAWLTVAKAYVKHAPDKALKAAKNARVFAREVCDNQMLANASDIIATLQRQGK